MGFSDVTARDTTTGGIVCFGLHVKDLPVDPFLDDALSSYGWKAATSLYLECILSDPAPPLIDWIDSLTFV